MLIGFFFQNEMEKFNLKWNDFEKNFCKSVRDIRKELNPISVIYSQYFY